MSCDRLVEPLSGSQKSLLDALQEGSRAESITNPPAVEEPFNVMHLMGTGLLDGGSVAPAGDGCSRRGRLSEVSARAFGHVSP